jgi:hypothetical protein
MLAEESVKLFGEHYKQKLWRQHERVCCDILTRCFTRAGRPP